MRNIYKGETKGVSKEELPISYGKKDYMESIRIWPEQVVKAPNDAQLDYPVSLCG